MSKKVILLSSEGLKNITLNDDEENQFYFHFGDTEIKMNKFFAEFISPSVSHLHKIDPTICSINYDTSLISLPNIIKDKINTIFSEDIISLLVQISRGISVSINENQSYKLLLASIILDNEELFQKINENYPISLNESNIDFILQFLQLFHHFQIMSNSNSQFSYTNVIDFISKHFYSIEKQKLFSLNKSALYSIISNDNLLIESEDSLLDFITNFFQNYAKNDQDNEYDIADFLELIEFEKLSEEKFKEFAFGFNASEMTNSLWQKLCKCFLKSSKDQEKHHQVANKGEIFEYDGNSSHSLQGIINHLTQKCGGNVSEKGVVNVTASSIQRSSQLPKYAVDFDDKESLFHSDAEKNAWLMYDFGDIKVRPSYYTMRSHYCGKANHHPRCWVIEGSNNDNEKDWKILDTRNDVTELDEGSASHTFKIQENLEVNECFRYLRIRLIGADTAGLNCYHLVLSALEFFGAIFHQM